MKTQPAHIHTPLDGRGLRDVTLNGKRVRGVVFADTRKGKIVMHDDPVRIHKHRKRAIVRTRYGVVEVVMRT